MIAWTVNSDNDSVQEDIKPRGGYATKKDLLILLGGIGLLILALLPLYFNLLKENNSRLCKQYMKSIFDATRLYAEENDGRLPPTHFDAGGQAVTIDGMPITWASIVQKNMKDSKHFACPESKAEERAIVMPFVGSKPIELTYGMTAANGMRILETMSSPSTTALFAETVNAGAMNTFNPLPFGSEDAFLIGYSSGNSLAPGIAREATHVTRLAFYQTKNGEFKPDGPARHQHGIHVIFADGSLGSITPERAAAEKRSKREDELVGLWATR